ncbi:hypothetical protein L596_008244 [Steinernema carpocapsae]|uniref:Uncharacterized protein n=1 Tax=Steinernema carpocapsae TaxID=34508 RepID=A0A4U5PBW0_STECR|nr:hypothetical protein L596_008244 [Steinernema carpocapsae]
MQPACRSQLPAQIGDRSLSAPVAPASSVPARPRPLRVQWVPSEAQLIIQRCSDSASASLFSSPLASSPPRCTDSPSGAIQINPGRHSFA